MLPVLFTLTIPAAVAKAFAVGLAALLAGGRAWAYRRRLAKEKREVGFGAALWDDRWTLVGIAAVLALLWRSGILDRDLRLPLHSYGLMIAAAFIVAIALAQREARRQGQARGHAPERCPALARRTCCATNSPRTKSITATSTAKATIAARKWTVSRQTQTREFSSSV